MPRLEVRELPPLSLSDFSRGILSGASERGVRRPNWFAGADNIYGRPVRARRVRPGSRDISTATLADEPHSLMGYYAGGGNKLFVGSSNKIHEAQALAYSLQTLPASYPESSDIWTHTNLNGVLIAAQRTGSLGPLEYDGAWKTLKLPKPTDSIGFSADTVGGSVDAGTHYYRIRWRFSNGSSLAGPVSVAHVVANPNNTVNINAGLADPSPARSDYIGWTLERTKVNGTSLGPWWFVKDGTGTTAQDTSSDANLGYIVDDGLHGEPPHFDGVTSFANLLWGWSGSNLYVSRDIGGIEATGIANFDAEDLFPISKDDGDTIQVCLVVLDELLILKKRSVHVISGVDRDSFVLTSVVYADPSRGSEAGCGGPRAACVIGGKAYFWGEGGLFSYGRGSISPVAWIEMGRYLEAANSSALDKLVLVNHTGNFLMAWFPSGSSSVANEQIVYDVRLNQWWHWKGWAARDVIELKGGLFGNASMVICDPVNQSGYHCWSVFDGTKDKRASDGTGGSMIRVVEELPWIDWGLPDDWKDLDRVAISSDAEQPPVSISIATDPLGGDAALSMPASNSGGNDWAEDVASNPNDLEWDVGDWAVDSPSSVDSGVPGGTLGKRFKLTLTADVDSDYKPTGIELYAALLPDKEY